jgi:uroporphyrinogen-III synthase
MPSVLSTKNLTEAQKNLILQAGFSLTAYNAINTVELTNLDYLKKYQAQNAIITSQKTISILKKWKVDLENVFCVGAKTASKLKPFNAEIVEKKNYGKHLAEVISHQYSDLKFDLFCGKLRNEELPEILKKNKVNFKEHHLYETLSNPKEFKRFFDAILFFSPSGVKSYYENNKFKGERIICIGKTTASAAKEIATQVEIASKPSIESVIVKLVKD